MSYFFSVEDDLQTCREQLEEFGSSSSKFRVNVAQKINKDSSLDFEVRRKDTIMKAVSPKFYGTLSSSHGETQILGEIREGTSGTRFIKRWCYGISILGSIATAAIIVLSLRTRAAGFAEEQSGAGLMPLLFIFAGLFFASTAEGVQRKEPKELLMWLYNSFDHKPDEESIEKASMLENAIDFKGLSIQMFKLCAAGLIIGTPLGFMADIEDNLDPLQITVTDIHACTKSADGSRFIHKKAFQPTDMVYGCGDLAIEIIDHRQIKIPIWLRRDYQNSNEGPAGYIAHEVNLEGNFALPLKEPKDGRYQIGQYTMEIGRNKNRFGQITFDVVE